MDTDLFSFSWLQLNPSEPRFNQGNVADRRQLKLEADSVNFIVYRETYSFDEARTSHKRKTEFLQEVHGAFV